MSRIVDVVEAEQLVEVVRQIKPLDANDLKIAESRRVVFSVILDAGIELGACMLPDYWANAAPKLHPRALIEVEPLDGSWLALLRVTEVGPEHARVALVYRVEFPLLHPPTSDDIPRGHDVAYLGPKRLWAAMRGTQILKHSFTSKGVACAWLVETTRG